MPSSFAPRMRQPFDHRLDHRIFVMTHEEMPPIEPLDQEAPASLLPPCLDVFRLDVVVASGEYVQGHG